MLIDPLFHHSDDLKSTRNQINDPKRLSIDRHSDVHNSRQMSLYQNATSATCRFGVKSVKTIKMAQKTTWKS